MKKRFFTLLVLGLFTITLGFLAQSFALAQELSNHSVAARAN